MSCVKHSKKKKISSFYLRASLFYLSIEGVMTDVEFSVAEPLYGDIAFVDVEVVLQVVLFRWKLVPVEFL